MSNSSTFTIACALCVGAAREQYLAAALAAIADVVDVLIVNDNSGLRRSENVAILEDSPFARDGRLRIVRNPFVDFARMRNDGFAPVRSLDPLPEWVMFLDADEVHGEAIRSVARDVLPRLGPDAGQLDGYTYHFFGTFNWITDIARRLTFYRYDQGLRWINSIHERLTGVRGRAIVIPYLYHHYGNVGTPRALATKHGRYYDLGNPVARPPDPAEATAAIYLAKAGDVRPYRGPHPPAARATIAKLQAENVAAFAALDAGFAARRGLRVRFAAGLRAANEGLRVRLRSLEHPDLFQPERKVKIR